MKKRVLLVDESLTVQKVVSLTLDKNRFLILFAKSRGEVMKIIAEGPPDLILVSDQVSDINFATFPKEVETWLGGLHETPPILLITGQDIKEQKHFAGVLRKPFTPQSLQNMVNDHLQPTPAGGRQAHSGSDDFEDQRLQKIFNETFADEATLVRETFKAEHEMEEATLITRPKENNASVVSEWEEAGGNLWDVRPVKAPPKPTPVSRQPAVSAESLWSVQPTVSQTPNASSEMATPSFAGALSEEHLEEKLQTNDLAEIVDRVLNRIVPPIVERLVQERLDKLLKEQDQFFELKP